MQKLIEHINEQCGHSSDRLALEAGLKQYMEHKLQVVSQQQPGDLTGTAKAAVAWGCELSRDDFYLQLGSALQERECIELTDLELSGRHSLTWLDATWLLMKHNQWGDVAILQRSFS